MLRLLTCAAALFALATVLSASQAFACTGDCDASGAVTVDEAMLGVAIALGEAQIDSCVAFDRDGSSTVAIDELVRAVKVLLLGCSATPGATRTATEVVPPTATPSGSPSLPPTATPTPTASVNQPPRPATASIYRSFEGQEIRVALATDPEGGPVECDAAALPAGATIDGNQLYWTPSDQQLGPHYVPFSCSDAAVPPLSTDGELAFKVQPIDPCGIPSCTPAGGCTIALPPPAQLCCTDEVIPRVAEPSADCPAGRVVFVGRNVTGFGRLQNCDVMQVRVFAQSGAQFSLKVESRCLDFRNRIDIAVKLESKTRGVMVDALTSTFFFETANGFARPVLPSTFTVQGGGPFFDIEEDGEANLSVKLTDAQGVSVETQLRVRLRFNRPPDLPETD